MAQRGLFASVPDLEAVIDEYLGAWNDDSKPFVVDSIVEKISKFRQTLEAIAPGSTLPGRRKRVPNSPRRA